MSLFPTHGGNFSAVLSWLGSSALSGAPTGAVPLVPLLWKSQPRRGTRQWDVLCTSSCCTSMTGDGSSAPTHCSGQSYNTPSPTHPCDTMCRPITWVQGRPRGLSREVLSASKGHPDCTLVGTSKPFAQLPWDTSSHGCIFSLPPRRYKDGKLIPKQSQSSMQIKDVSEQHAGTYTLVLRNRLAGLEKRISLQLIVNGKGSGLEPGGEC